ncbi:MAG: hypothetical protein ACTFAL_12025 [Candidatus Electronema sp. V4]|uniref:hypothetical protein n=1 Tax=Candidatus Electronema sp. V4 TaxID=3454756 RepID=UPI0040556852
MRRALFAVVSMAFAVSGLTTAWAGEKEEELLKAMEAIVQQYKAEESSQQQSIDRPPPAAMSAAEQQNSQLPQQAQPIQPETAPLPEMWTNSPTVQPPPSAAGNQTQQVPAQTTPSSAVPQESAAAQNAAPPAASAAAPEAAKDLFPLEPQPSWLANDDIINVIEQAVRQYRANDLAGAISNLDYAAQLIRQKKSERMKALLPEPLPGWQAKAAAAKSLGAAVFGGGSTVSRDYFTASSVLSMEIVSDSPVLQSIIMMLNNPLFAGASGGNIQTIKQQRAMIKYNANDRSGEINIVVAGRFIVTIKGRAVDQDTMLRYAEAMDFEALARN